ncbi:uncharacterized protein [Oscarella lobularis]|uniref:uncharacterized protein n=1 Tax=Oscarella lobularis TaxID=121494 RepID=UPI0033131EEC
MCSIPWGQKMVEHIHKCNRFSKDRLSQDCFSFFVDSEQLGIIRDDILIHFERFPSVFDVNRTNRTVKLSDTLKTSETRSEAMERVLIQLRDEKVIKCLQGWRNECYSVTKNFMETPVFAIERAAAGLLGVKQYGCHLSAYYRSDSEYYMWIGRRSPQKQTFPGMLDNTAAGGMSVGMNPTDTIVKECQEEAGILPELSVKACSVGTISYFYEDERGLFPETDFLFDLEVPRDFIPRPIDEEMAEFYCWSANEVKTKLCSGEFKPNCALILLDFLIRHGLLSPDKEPLYSQLVSGIHNSFPF